MGHALSNLEVLLPIEVLTGESVVGQAKAGVQAAEVLEGRARERLVADRTEGHAALMSPMLDLHPAFAAAVNPHLLALFHVATRELHVSSRPTAFGITHLLSWG